MQDSKLISLLKTLSGKELTRFEEYVESPYFNKHEQLRKLCRYLVKQSSNWSHERNLKKEKIFAHLYPGQDFDAPQINRLASMLLQLLHDFLVSERLHSPSKALENKLLLLEELRKRKSDKDYNGVLQQYQRLSESLLQETPDAYFYRYRLHKELNALFIDKGGRQFDENLQLKNNYFDVFFVVEKLRIACDMSNRNIIVRSNYETTMFEYLWQYAEKENIAAIPSVQIYKAIYLMRSSETGTDDRHYQELKRLLEQHSGQFHKGELMDIYSYILNHCTKKINEGQTQYYQEILRAYQFLVEYQIIFIDGFLPAWDYKNMVTAALRVQEYQLALVFIEQYQHFLPPDSRNNVYRYNLAAYHYAVKNYGAALIALHDVEFTDASYYIGAKTIQLKSYYELGESEALESLIEAFSTYLRRNRDISEYWKESNLNTLKITRRLHKLKQQQDFLRHKKVEEVKTKLRNEIEQTSPLANKDWLLHSLDILEE